MLLPIDTPSGGNAFPIFGFDAATSSTVAYLIWYTPDMPSTSQIYWSEVDQYAYVTFVDNNLTTQHAMTIGGLKPNTTYLFQAVSTDAEGHISYSNMIIKTTKP